MRREANYSLLMLCAAVVAAVCTLVIDRWHPLVPLAEELALLDEPTQEQIGIIRSHNQRNDSYVFALFGALTLLVGTPLVVRGLTVGLKLVAILACALLGIVAGFAIAHIGFYCQDWLPMWDTLVRSAVLRSAMFIPLGIVGGLLTAVFHRMWGQSFNLLLGGVIGGISAALVYCLLAGFLFQNENSDAILPVGFYSRLLLFGATPFLIWAFIAMQFSSSKVAALEPATGCVEAA